MSKAQQRKGRSGEFELVKVLRARGIDARPGKALSFGSEADVIGWPGVHIECKRCEHLRVSEWVAQAEADAARMGDGLPVVCFRQSRQPWRVVLRLDDLLNLMGVNVGDDV